MAGLDDWSEDDLEKLRAFLREFGKPDDVVEFIATTKADHLEQKHRRWALGVLKRTAAAVVLLAATWAALVTLSESVLETAAGWIENATTRTRP